MNVLKFEITTQGAYRVKYVDDDLVEITATYEEDPCQKVLELLAQTKYLFMRVMHLDAYVPDLADRLIMSGINVKQSKGPDEYEIIASFNTPGYSKYRKIISYPLRPGDLVTNELTGEVYRDVDVQTFPYIMNDTDVQLIESLLIGVQGFVLGERDGDGQLELSTSEGSNADM